MALTQKSLFLYGYTISATNRFIDFKTSSSGSTLTASIPLGTYSLTLLLSAISSALSAVDLLNTYNVNANRAINGNLENRITISTTGSFLSLLFSSGPNSVNNCSSLLGFSGADLTGSTSYTSTLTSGTSFVPSLIGYNFINPTQRNKCFGKVNLSSSGNRETIVYSTQTYFQMQFKYIPTSEALNSWTPLLNWSTQGKLIEFTPDITQPSNYYEAWLEQTSLDGNGLGYELKEMLPSFPFYYDTGIMLYRVRPL